MAQNHPSITLSKPYTSKVLAQSSANASIYQNADEETKIRMEKDVGEDLLKEYFSAGDGFRVRLDENKPEMASSSTGAVVPKEHIVLYRIEKRAAGANVQSSSLPDGNGMSSADTAARGDDDGNDDDDDDDDDDDSGWKIHTLYLYVHADSPAFPPETLAKKLHEMTKEKDEQGELLGQGTAFSILQWGMEICFFQYQGNKVLRVG